MRKAQAATTGRPKGRPRASKPIKVNPYELYRLQIQAHGLDKLRESGKKFHLTFIRQSDKVVDGQTLAKAGDEWVMTCRFGVPKTPSQSPDPVRRERDALNGVITVFQEGPDGGFKCVRVDSIVKVEVIE